MGTTRTVETGTRAGRKPPGPGVGNPPSPATGEFRRVRTRRTFEEVISQVRELLFRGSLKPGDRLPPERELSTLLGVGRPALREALRALEVSGLIVLRKGKTGGAFIAESTPGVVVGGMSDMLRLGSVSVEELFEAREWFLSALVRPACRRITLPAIRALEENVAGAERLHAEGRFQERIALNFEFYGMLAKATRNPVAMMVVQGLTQTLRSLIDKVGSDLSPNFFGNRRDLLKALAARDEDAAARIMAHIVKSTEQTYKRLVKARLEPVAQTAAPAVPRRAPRGTAAAVRRPARSG